jgi:membrane-associated protease RseP (regulator of RpoE activity)
VRLVRITGVDLRVFDYDYDLTWMAFFLNADGQVYGRYGGRDARDAEARLSKAGLRFAMQEALAAHWTYKPMAPTKDAPLLAEAYPAAKKAGHGCVHCHQVNEFRRAELQSTGKWNRDQVWVYPLPENVGITLDVDQGNRVKSVQPGSPAAAIGIAAGDRLRTLGGTRIASFADAQYALHRAPARGAIAVTWLHGDDVRSGSLALRDGWRKTNLAWRPSMLDILPALTVYGDDLTAADKKVLGLAADRLAFRQQMPVHKDARAAGVEAGDIIMGVDGLELRMTVDQFLAYMRRNYLVGDRVTLNVVRNGKRIELPMTLR